MHKKPMPLIFSADENQNLLLFHRYERGLGRSPFRCRRSNFSFRRRWSLVGPKWQADRIIYDQR